jgi:hypothetical protein
MTRIAETTVEGASSIRYVTGSEKKRESGVLSTKALRVNYRANSFNRSVDGSHNSIRHESAMV